jgi:signal peptidase I
MLKLIQTLFLSLLTPGLGYLNIGNKKNFYKTILLFYGVIACGVIFRLFTSYHGIVSIIICLITIYLFTAIHAIIKVKTTKSAGNSMKLMRFVFTISFILITCISFGKRRQVMGFDIMSMGVPVMQPTVLPYEKFLVNTWAYKNSLPQRGDVIVHSFNNQKGVYLNRIIAIENDKIEIKNGFVFLNRKVLNEPYVLSLNVTKPQSKEMHALIIPKGQYFVMGDNRDASFGDSRFSGTITIRNIEGKITDIISSQYISRIGIAIN